MNAIFSSGIMSRIIGGGMSFPDILVYILSSLLVVFLTLPIHEFAHGFAASKLGDPTAKYSGRLTVNPFAHIDYIGALCIILFGFGWAKPVPVNPSYFRNPKRDMALTALAGPLSNLIVALISLILYYLLQVVFGVTFAAVTFVYYAEYFFYYIALINVSLAVFNLIPIPPLDGSRLLSALLPNKQYYALMRYERYFYIGLLVLLWIGVLDYPLGFLSNYAFRGLSFLASLPFRLIVR